MTISALTTGRTLRAARPARFRVAARVAAVVLLATTAACGGGEGGGPTEVTPTTPTARVDVSAQFILAPTTTGLQLRASAAYELAAGGTAPLADVTVPVTSTAAQTVPVTLNLSACVNNPLRAGADQGTGANAVCRVVVEYTLLAGSRVVDAQTFGTYTVRAGSQAPQSVTFTEITGVRVTRGDGTVVPDNGAIRLEIPQTAALTATALRADGAATSSRPVRWTSETPSVATVNETTGLVTPVAAGQARIVASSAGVQSAAVVTVVPAPSPVTVSVAGGVGSGTVTSSPAGVSCRVTAGRTSGTCSALFAADAAVTLTAVPDAGSTFDVWGGDCAAAAGALTCSVTPTAARTATVRFVAVRAFAVTLAGTGAGRVTSSPAGVDCAAAGAAGCSTTFLDGTAVTLTATPDADSRFLGWSNACGGTERTCAITVDQPRTAVATFGRRLVPIALQVSGPGAGSIALTGTTVTNGTCTTAGTLTTCTATAELGTAVTATATPASGSTFGTWSGDVCSGAASTPCTFTANAAVGATLTVATAFGQVPPQQTTAPIRLTVLSSTSAEARIDLVYERRLNGQPANSGLFTFTFSSTDAQPVFTLNADNGTPVKFTVRGNSATNSRIISWGGVCAGTPVTGPETSCTFTATPNVNVIITAGP